MSVFRLCFRLVIFYHTNPMFLLAILVYIFGS